MIDDIIKFSENEENKIDIVINGSFLVILTLNDEYQTIFNSIGWFYVFCSINSSDYVEAMKEKMKNNLVFTTKIGIFINYFQTYPPIEVVIDKQEENPLSGYYCNINISISTFSQNSQVIYFNNCSHSNDHSNNNYKFTSLSYSENS